MYHNHLNIIKYNNLTYLMHFNDCRFRKTQNINNTFSVRSVLEKECHWKRNCPAYLESLKKMKSVQIQDSSIFVIEVNLSTSTSWVLDTGCGSHICINVKELQRRRSLAKGEIDQRVGNGEKVVALAVGTYNLSLPFGLVLELNDCLYVSAICRNIISVSCLDKKGISFNIKDNSCSFALNDLTFCVARLFNGLYVLDYR